MSCARVEKEFWIEWHINRQAKEPKKNGKDTIALFSFCCLRQRILYKTAV